MLQTTRQQRKEVKRLLVMGGVMTLDQLTRLGLVRGMATMELKRELRSVRLNRSPRLLKPTFIALKAESLHLQPTAKLTHLALLADGARAIGVSPNDWTEVTTHSSGPTPDGVWIRGPIGGGIDWAVEVDTTYPWHRVEEKFRTFGPPGPFPTRSGTVHLSYLGVVWIVTSRHRRARVGRWLQTKGFAWVPVTGQLMSAGAQVYVWRGNGRSLQVWVVCAQL